jgi:hypothetical protein
LKTENTVSRTALAASLKTATELSKAMIQNLVSFAQQSLREQVVKSLDVSMRKKAEDALLWLEKTRAVLLEQFPGIVERILAERAADPVSSARLQFGNIESPLSLDALELMDDSQVQLRVQTARMQQATMLVCERELADLDALVSAVLGLSNVAPSRNPFKPQSFIDALNEVIDQTPATAAAKTLWSSHLGAGLGQELKSIYHQLCAELRAMGMVAPTYRVVPMKTSRKAEAKASLESSPSTASTVAASPAVSANDMRVTLEQLRNILAAKAPSEYQAMTMKNADLGEIAGLLRDSTRSKNWWVCWRKTIPAVTVHPPRQRMIPRFRPRWFECWWAICKHILGY